MLKHIAAGGTFDLFHNGHRDFLKSAYDLADKITVGVTSDKFVRTLGKNPFDTENLRLKNVENYLKEISGGRDFSILVIDDTFGTAIKDKTIDSIAVTANTNKGALIINKKRLEENLKPLKVLMLPLTQASDGKPISSTRIKNGEISKEGLNYLNYLKSFKVSKLTEELRGKLKKPQGFLYGDINTFLNDGFSQKLISVGDEITYNLLQRKVIPMISIVDFKVERKKKFGSLDSLGFDDNQDYMAAKNPSGSITSDLVNSIGKVLEGIISPRVIIVNGEEDLAVLPAVLLSPLGTTVAYGQRSEGLVKVTVDLKTKRRFLRLYNSFLKVRI